jgi:hypothetical protein
MIKLLLFLLLMVSTNVFAEWTKVTDSADGSFSVYVDYGFIKKKGNKVTMWYVYDFEKVQILIEIIRYLSEARRDEFDCEEATVRRLDWYQYDENINKQGNVVNSWTNINYISSIVPNSIDDILLKVACGKK